MYITLNAINFQAQKLRQIGVPPWLQILASSTWLIKNVLFHSPTPSPTTTKIETTTKKTPPLNLQSRRGNALKGQVHDSAHAC